MFWHAKWSLHRPIKIPAPAFTVPHYFSLFCAKPHSHRPSLHTQKILKANAYIQMGPNRPPQAWFIFCFRGGSLFALTTSILLSNAIHSHFYCLFTRLISALKLSNRHSHFLYALIKLVCT